MSEHTNATPLRRAQMRTFFWFAGASIVLVALGLIGQLRWPLLLLVGGVPLLIGLVLAVKGTRPSRGDPERFNIRSQRARARGQLEVSLSPMETKSAIRMAVASLEHFTISGETHTGTEVRVRWSTKSWGEIIALRVEPLEDSKSRIMAEVRPRISTNVIDFDQGAEDLAALLSQVELISHNR